MHIKRNQRVTVAGIAATALLLTLFGVFQAGAQTPPTVAQDMAAKEVTLTGRVVDLHCWMTGKMSDADQVKCTQTCIHAGVPAGLETEEGIVVLGHGEKSPAALLEGHALKQIIVKGMLYEKRGVKYLDIAAIVNPLAQVDHEEDPQD